MLAQDITWDNAEEVRRWGVQEIAAGDTQAQDLKTQEVQIDLGAQTQANSVTVAVMSAWVRAASLHNKSIVFVNLSGDLRNIIALSGLDDVLNLEPSTSPT